MALHAYIITAWSFIATAPSIPRLSSDSTMQGSPSSTVIHPLRAFSSPSSLTILSSVANAGSSPANHPMNVPSPAQRHSPGRVSIDCSSTRGVSTTALLRGPFRRSTGASFVRIGYICLSVRGCIHIALLLYINAGFGRYADFSLPVTSQASMTASDNGVGRPATLLGRTSHPLSGSKDTVPSPPGHLRTSCSKT